MPHLRIILVTAAIAIFAAACTGPTPTPTAEPPASPEPTTAPFPATPENGLQVAQQFGCSACHSSDGNVSVGPTWMGLFGSERPLADGTTVTADEAYLRDSVLDPNAKVAEGFREGIMPQNFGERLSDEQLAALIAYIKSLQ